MSSDELAAVAAADVAQHQVWPSGRQLRSPAATHHAFLWPQGRRIDLGTLGGDFSAASGINDHGAVVGQATAPDGGGRGFVWRHGP